MIELPKNFFLIFLTLAVIPTLLFLDNSYGQEKTESVPEWIKTTAMWYGEGKVSEQEFLNAITFLIEKKIIKIDVAKIIPTTTNEEIKSSSSQVPVSKPRLNTCQVLHPAYNSMSPIGFKTKYSHINYINECIKLYKDPVWSYKGEDRLDKLYLRLTELIQEAKQQSPKLSTEPNVKIISSTQIGTEKFLVKFNVCAGDELVEKAKILVKSEIESIVIGSSKDIPANACRTYETQLHAKHVANINASIIEQFLRT